MKTAHGKTEQKQVARRGLYLVFVHPAPAMTALLLALLLNLCGLGRKGNVFASPVTEELWGISQDCSYQITEPHNSLDLTFNDQIATCQGNYSREHKTWTYTGFQQTSLTALYSAAMEIRFSVSGWENDSLALQVSNNQGEVWTTLDSFDEIHPPPVELTIKTYELSDLFFTPEEINAARVRLRGEEHVRSLDMLTISMDEVRLVISGELQEEVVPTAPQDQPMETVISTPTLEPSPEPPGKEDRTHTPGPSVTPTETGTLGEPTDIVPSESPGPTVTSTQNEPSVEPANPTPEATDTPTEKPPGEPSITPTPVQSIQTPTVSPTAQSTADEPETPIIRGVLAPQPTPTSSGLVPADIPAEADPHASYAPGTDSCAACHRTHTAVGTVLLMNWPEEAVCFACHTTNGSGTDVQQAFSYQNTSSRFFEHDIELTNGTHNRDEQSADSFSAENRHVECEDCHEPHNASRGTVIAPSLQFEMNSASGVDPLWTAPGPPDAYIWLPQAEREYQVCFKCHSSFTTLPSYSAEGWDGNAFISNGLAKLTSTDPSQVPDWRDLGREFNPYQASFHPVVAEGRNQNIPTESFVPGWSQTSMLYCTDCHANAETTQQASGPHGSPLLHILTGANGGWTNYSTVFVENVSPSNQSICFKCHDYDTYARPGNAQNTNFRRGMKNLHAEHTWFFGGTCYMCHDTHGSEQQHLLNFDASTAGGIIFLNNTNSQTSWVQEGEVRTCYLACHGEDHSQGKSYRP